MVDPKISDNDHGEISATVNGNEVRGWSYKDDAERRVKMLMAHEFAEGWFQAIRKDAAAAPDMLAALENIYGMHLGDCPASMDEADFARAHVHRIRMTARSAIAKACNLTDQKPSKSD